MRRKPVTKEQKAFRFYNTAAGHLVLTVIIWFIGFNLFLLATDTGSLLQWGGVLISLFWGLYHFVMSVQMFIKKVWQKLSKNS